MLIESLEEGGRRGVLYLGLCSLCLRNQLFKLMISTAISVSTWHTSSFCNESVIVVPCR